MKTRAEWCEILEFTDVCFAPVLSMQEAPNHVHNRDRKAFVEIDGKILPAPGPRFSRTPASIKGGVTAIERDPSARLAAWGIS
jgi:alpha-methylacyl-CoA racemase